MIVIGPSRYFRRKTLHDPGGHKNSGVCQQRISQITFIVVDYQLVA